MKQQKIKNENGKVLKTEDGKELIKKTLEQGDIFIPTSGVWSEKKGEMKYEKLKVKAKVNGDNETIHYITLTPTSYKKLKEFDSEKDNDITAHKWRAYTFEGKNGKGLSVTINKERKLLNFDDDKTEKPTEKQKKEIDKKVKKMN